MNRSYPLLNSALVLFLAVALMVTPDANAQSASSNSPSGPSWTVGGKNLPQVYAGVAGPVIPGPALGGNPPNDNCQDAVIENLADGGSFTRLGDNTGATDQFGFGNSVWEAFTTTECLDVTIEYCGTDPAFGGAFTFLFVGCPLTNLVVTSEANITDQSCGDGNLTLIFPQVPAGTYYYGVLQYVDATGPYELTFSGAACTATPPVYDVCEGAISVVPSPDCVSVTGDANGTGLGVSSPAIACPGSIGDATDDIWFSFVATAEEHTVSVTPSDLYDAVVDVLSGLCGTMTQIGCADLVGEGIEETVELTGLSIGETYYVRVYDWYAGLPGTTTVDVCVIGPAPEVCDADAGTLTADAAEVCFEDDMATVSATANGDAGVPAGFELLYVLTQGGGQVIVNAGTLPDFVVDATDSYTIHTLVYDPLTLDLSVIEPGVTTAADVNAMLIQGGGDICASLDMVGAPVDVILCCDADAGTLTADAEEVCFEDDMATVSAAANGDAVVPAGFELLYVLTQGGGQVIVNAGTLPEFVVDATDIYTIHTLVYDPLTLDLSVIEPGVTTAADVHAMLIQGGGDICASLDLLGAPVDVIDCTEPCDAVAGTLTADAAEVCFEDDMATVSATANGDAVVPAGFELLYVLTQGGGQVIVNAGTLPEFVVDAIDSYTIHTLVYDPLTLDLSVIEPGVTTAADVNAMLIQGGGTICASLDMVGAPVDVILCCDADAGALTPDAEEVCFEDDMATVSATANGDAVVPAGFELLYVLTQGGGQVIVNAGTLPEFVVDATDSYTIHTLVYDPLTLDLSVIEPGVTTAADVHAMLIQGGGTICASLDMVGASVDVILCCDANAGTITADLDEVCLVAGMAVVSATPNGDGEVPVGFEVVYVLTTGVDLTIMQTDVAPNFVVNAIGDHTIHTLVYDPSTLDLTIIEAGVTTASDIDGLLIQGGGTICASLDMIGASVEVMDCTPANDDCANAQILGINAVDGCVPVAGNNTYATQDAGDPDCDNTNASYADVWYSFNSGSNTTVNIEFDSGDMEDWAIVVYEGCGGAEVVCEIQPDAPIEVTVDTGTDYVVRVYSNLQFGTGGAFTICVTGDVPTFICDGGEVTTGTGAISENICQDDEEDVLEFVTSSASLDDYTFLLTNELDEVITLLAGNSLDFNSAALGTYHVWGVSHNGALVGAVPGAPASGITSEGGCIELSADFVTVNVEICTGVQAMAQVAWNLFPNPGNGDFMLQYEGPDGTVQVEVIDMGGRVAHVERRAMVHGGSMQFSLAGQLAPGSYLVLLTTGSDRNALRMVVR